MQITPKPGRLGSGAYHPDGIPITGDPFGHKGDNMLGVHGTGFSTRVSSASAVAPLSGFHDTATQRDIGAQTLWGQVGVSPPHAAPLVMPHERGRFFGRSTRPVVELVGGGSNQNRNDTAFHPDKANTVTVRPVRRPQVEGHRYDTSSFPSRVRLMQDPNFQPHGGAGRWTTIKRGVV